MPVPGGFFWAEMEGALSKLRERLWKLPINEALKAEPNLPLASARRLPCFLQASSRPRFAMLPDDAAPPILQARSPSARGTRVPLPSSAPHSPRVALEGHRGLGDLCQGRGWKNHLANGSSHKATTFQDQHR